MGIAIQRANVFFIAAFTFEAVLKIIALDFIWDKHSYLRNGERIVAIRDQWLMLLSLLQDGMCWTSLLLSLACLSSPLYWKTTFTFIRALRILCVL